MRSPHPESKIARRDLWSLAGLAAAGILLGGAATVALRTAGDWMNPVAAVAAESTAGRAVEAAKKAAEKAETRNAKVDAAAGVTQKTKKADKTAAATKVKKGSKAAPAKSKKAGEAPKTSVSQPLAQVEDQVTYQYNALGRRDPFQAIVGGEFIGADVGGSAPPDIGGLEVVGVVWGARDKFAMVEDPRGNSMVLRRGDKVMNGVVKRLRRDALEVEYTVDGQSQLVTIPLKKKGDKNASQ